TFARLDFLPIFLARGWLRASFGAPLPHVTQQSPDVAEVDVDLPIEPGLQYRTKDFTFAGFNVLSPQQLIHEPAGQIANEVQLQKDVAALKDFYESRGYLKAHVSAAPQFDDSAATVVFALQAEEGSQYRMGEFEVEGVEKSAAARLVDAWTLRAGEPYDRTYLKRYSAQLSRVYPHIEEMKATMEETPDESTHAVDVLLRCTPK
ncbi:MAG: hypothetical protein JO187_03165, partial [Acidobacteria bacterium]|nr:hypothetical protein [Acidobacteriota bacterium]